MGVVVKVARSAARRLNFSRALGVVLLLFASGIEGAGVAASVTLMWSATPGISSYNVYYGTVSRSYPNRVSVSNSNQVTISSLKPFTTYYFAVTSVAFGLESAYSDEIVFTPPTLSPVLTVAASGGGTATLAANAPGGHTYDVLLSRDLSSWTWIGVMTAGTDGAATFIDRAAWKFPARFYLLHDITYATSPSFKLSLNLSGQTELQVHGLAGHTYTILATGDLLNWQPLGRTTLGLGGTATFTNAVGGFLAYDVEETIGL